MFQRKEKKCFRAKMINILEQRKEIFQAKYEKYFRANMRNIKEQR